MQEGASGSGKVQVEAGRDESKREGASGRGKAGVEVGRC